MPEQIAMNFINQKKSPKFISSIFDRKAGVYLFWRNELKRYCAENTHIVAITPMKLGG